MTVDNLINKIKVLWWDLRYPYKRPDERIIFSIGIGYHLELEKRISEGHQYWVLVTGKNNNKVNRLTLENEELLAIKNISI